MLARLNNNIIDERLRGRSIKRLGDYINAKTPIHFQCLIELCAHIWDAIPCNIARKSGEGTGCPACYKREICITNEYVDDQLYNTNNIRLDNVINSATTIRFQCTICGYIRKVFIHGIINSPGCANCNGNAILNDDIICSKLQGRDIKILDLYINNHIPHRFQCLIYDCNYIWKASIKDVINHGTGCPNCAGNILFTDDIINQILLPRNIKRIDPYINSKTAIRFQCMINDCNYIWRTRPNNIMQGCGCPKCKFGKNEKRINALLLEYNIPFIYHQRLIDLDVAFPNYIIDFYIPLLRLFIEYNGEQHYKPVQFDSMTLEQSKDRFIKQQIRDQTLEQLCKNNKYNLICIDGRIYRNNTLDEYIINIIIPSIQSQL